MADDLTVEQALKELRWMFSAAEIKYEVGGSSVLVSIIGYHRMNVNTLFEAVSRSAGTLTEAMAQVRAWKESKQID